MSTEEDFNKVMGDAITHPKDKTEVQKDRLYESTKAFMKLKTFMKDKPCTCCGKTSYNVLRLMYPAYEIPNEAKLGLANPSVVKFISIVCNTCGRIDFHVLDILEKV